MSLLSELQTIYARFNDNLPLPAARISWDGFNGAHGGDAAPFTPPTVDVNDPDASMWQRIKVRSAGPGQAFGIGAGSDTLRRWVLIVDTFRARHTGYKELVETHEAALDLFHRSHISNITGQEKPTADLLDSDEYPAFKQCHSVLRGLTIEGSTTAYVEETYVE